MGYESRPGRLRWGRTAPVVTRARTASWRDWRRDKAASPGTSHSREADLSVTSPCGWRTRRLARLSESGGGDVGLVQVGDRVHGLPAGDAAGGVDAGAITRRVASASATGIREDTGAGTAGLRSIIQGLQAPTTLPSKPCPPRFYISNGESPRRHADNRL